MPNYLRSNCLSYLWLGLWLVIFTHCSKRHAQVLFKYGDIKPTMDNLPKPMGYDKPDVDYAHLQSLIEYGLTEDVIQFLKK